MKELKQNETGRSMVEMLGVLAIIGVLSIGAVSGYRWAMDKMAANDIVNEVKKRAIVASQQRIVNHALDLSEFAPKIRDTYTVTATDNYQGNIGAFTLSVSNIEQSVCDKILAQDWLLPVIIELNGADTSVDAACGETNTLLYVFNNDLDSGIVDGDETMPTCGPNEYVDINTGKCIEDTKCPVGEFFHGKYDENWNLSTICSPCPANIGDTVAMNSTWEDNCSKCQNSTTTTVDFSAYCLNCPSPRVACGTNCCAENEVCQADTSSWPHTYTCVSAQCKSDSDCGGEAPLCDTYTGTCFAGCHTNTDCASGEFCDLDQESTGRSCTQKPSRGTCRTSAANVAGAYTYSADVLNWWSAENFCKLHHKQLFNIDKLACYESGTNNKTTSGSCCKKGMTCDYQGGTFSDEILALQTAIGKNYSFWTRQSINSCGSLYVSLYSNNISFFHHADRYGALCE